MASADDRVVLDLRPLRKFEKAVMDGLRGGPASNAVRKGFKQVAVVYRAWAKERFTRFSRGGGDWAPLKPSTIAGRRKGSGKTLSVKRGGKRRTKSSVASGSVSILYDTGTLIGGLDPTFNASRGAKEQDMPFGIRVGFGGAARHPKAKDTSIADIARRHQAGSQRDNLPAREIIVEPPIGKQQEFAELMENALGTSWKRATA